MTGVDGPQGQDGPQGCKGVEGEGGPLGQGGPMGDAGQDGSDGAQGPEGPIDPALQILVDQLRARIDDLVSQIEDCCNVTVPPPAPYPPSPPTNGAVQHLGAGIVCVTYAGAVENGAAITHCEIEAREAGGATVSVLDAAPLSLKEFMNLSPGTWTFRARCTNSAGTGAFSGILAALVI